MKWNLFNIFDINKFRLLCDFRCENKIHNDQSKVYACRKANSIRLTADSKCTTVNWNAQQHRIQTFKLRCHTYILRNYSRFFTHSTSSAPTYTHTHTQRRMEWWCCFHRLKRWVCAHLAASSYCSNKCKCNDLKDECWRLE